jgi:hypothetical protein
MLEKTHDLFVSYAEADREWVGGFLSIEGHDCPSQASWPTAWALTLGRAS